MRLDMYVNYRGTCEEAFRSYEQLLGGTVTGIAPGTVTITATPAATSTGTGDHIACTPTVTVE